MRPAAAVLVRSLASGHRCPYVSSVTDADECPSARWTVTTSHPAAINPLA